MNARKPERSKTRRIRNALVAGPLVVTAALVSVALGYQLRESSSGVPAPHIEVPHEMRRASGEAEGVVPDGTTSLDDEVPDVAKLYPTPIEHGTVDKADDVVPYGTTGFDDDVPGVANRYPTPIEHRTVDEADGVVPDGTTVFDDWLPAVGNLNPALLDALRRAARDAAVDGVEFVVNSGWRSPEYQEELLREAVAQYGSAEEAARWVAAPTTSAHVSGDAVDIGPYDATAWLSEHGAGYGLCQIYGNEPWHFELRPDAVYQGCPPMYADPTHDPRMRGESPRQGRTGLQGNTARG